VFARIVVMAVVVSLAIAAAAMAAAGERPGRIGSRVATVGYGEDIQALGTLPTGRIVVAGTLRSGYPMRAFVRAYLPGGWADPSFGQAGEVEFDSEHWVGDMAVAPDGRIVLAFALGPPRLIRLNPDGSRDASFGSGGVVDADFGSAPFLEGLALYPDGRIVAVGNPITSDGRAVVVRRFLPDGSPDPSFGDDGRVDLEKGFTVYAAPALQPDGGIVVAIQGDEAGPRIARISADGRLDSGFGRGGLALLQLGRARWLSQVDPPYGFSWRPLVLPDGRIRIPVGFGAREHGSRLGLVGLTADGDVDRRFGRDGLALGPRPPVSDRDEWPRAAVGDPSGSILVAGSTARGDTLNGDEASVVRRFRPDGTLDRSFGPRGVFRGKLGTSETLEQELAVLDDDTLVFAEEASITRYQTFGGGTVSTLSAGYDRTDPSMSLVAGCRVARVRVTDLSGIEHVVVRAGARVIRRTARKRFRVRLPSGARRLSVRATDLAGNSSIRRVRLPRC
jgi:uncharacterized delta-60 repeat protein